MESIYEIVDMPDSNFRIKSFISSDLEHLIEVHPHWHPEIEILYFIEGMARQQINDKTFIAKAGDIVIINKDQIHSTYSYAGNGCSILVIMFDSRKLCQLDVENPGQDTVNILGSTTLVKNPIDAASDSGKQLQKCILNIHEELSNKNPAFQYMVRSNLYELTGMLLRNALFDRCDNAAKSIPLIKNTLKKTFELIDLSCHEDISLKQAASHSNLSIPHFCRLFKKATGMTFNDYLVFHRVNRAEKMLDSDKTLTEISLECGFGSISSFIRSFKKFKHCPPSHYRKNIT